MTTSDNRSSRGGATPISAVQPYIEAHGSVRLVNCVRVALVRRNMPYEALEDYLSDPLHLRLDKLKRIPNLGKKTASEFNELVVGFLESRDVVSRKIERVTTEKTEVVDGRLASQDADRLDSTGDNRYSNLTPREKDVIERRYAVGWDEKHTLEQIGQMYNVTRERIRQLEGKAFKKLRSTRNAQSWKRFISENQPEIIDALFGGQPLVNEPHKISGEFALAIAIIFGTPSKFLEQNTQKFENHYWAKPGFNVLSIQTARNRLAAIASEVAVLPISVREAAKALDESWVVIEAAVSALEGHNLYEGWIIRGTATVRKKRIVNILNLFFERSLVSPATLWEMKVAYWSKYIDDKCSGRDLLLSLREHPAHFINLRELGWVCLAIESKREHHSFGLLESQIGVPDELYSRPIKKGHGLANCVYEMFDRHGPLRLADAADIFQREYPRYKLASMYPMLVYFAVFRRFAPGILGIQAHCRSPDALCKARAIMLTKHDLDLYLLSCAAGPPRLRYPLWDTEMEKLWATWLAEKQDVSRLGSLLSVARIAEWNVSDSERRNWQSQKKRLNGRIDSPANRLFSERKIDGSMLTTALAAASVFGYVNWMYLNQGLGWRVETSRVAVVMAVLVRIGALKPIGQWSEPHILTKRGREIAKLIIGRSIVPPAEPRMTIMDCLEECDEANREFGWARSYCWDQLVLQITDCSGDLAHDFDTSGEENLDIEAAYEGFMGDALKLLVEGENWS